MTTAATLPPDRFMPYEEVIRLTSLCRATIKNRIRDGKFPAPCNLGGRRVGWPANEVHAWLAERYEDRQKRAA